ncbi:hypothetical protein HU200_021249 [Digitaria exilis]|uniref:F-box domain-containing protein n=1 Tax=Digitaria exilis TaxID=1010633 RepID=A0A835F029_9POAL|nr:hypothetical protein HU200_021249 [Digitaria exilis]CAB3472851.1 unnamed protein product [Digitaria exilis]
MPPARRARGGAHRAAPYHRRGWLNDDGGGLLVSDDDDGEPLPIPDDALSPVLARLPSGADVVRSAATCRRWARLVAKDGAVLSRALPQLPCLTLGFLHQEDAGTTARRRKASSGAAAHPCFVPTASAARLIGLQAPSSTALADAVLGLGDVLEHARPVASRNGWLVLELRQERYTDSLKLCVCNPTRGDMAMLPPLAGADKPGDYACALYTGHDLGTTPRPLSAFFRLLIVYNRRAFTALRSYSSDTGRWSTEGKRSRGPKIAFPRELGQSIVVDGVAYWHLRHSAFAVRVDTPEPTEVPMPTKGPGISNWPRGWRSLGVDPDGKLIFIDASPCMDEGTPVSHHLVVATRSVFCPGSGSGDSDCSGEWVKRFKRIKLKQLKVRYEGWFGGVKTPPPFQEKVNLRWFSEKSGTLLFTLGKGTGSPGAFVLNIATGHVEKVADGVDCDLWRNFVGYEIDGAAYLASILRR